MKRTKAKPALNEEPQHVSDDCTYSEHDDGIKVAIKHDNGYGYACETIPWSLLRASVRRYQAVQRMVNRPK